eukprot:14039-Rhodomonas_salina.2
MRGLRYSRECLTLTRLRFPPSAPEIANALHLLGYHCAEYANGAQASPSTVLPLCYAVPGTELVYAATAGRRVFRRIAPGAPGAAPLVLAGAASVYGGTASVYGDSASFHGDSAPVYGDSASINGNSAKCVT